MENDLDYLEEEKPRKFTLKWLFSIFLKPGQSLQEIANKDHAVWIAPLLILMISALLVILVAAPVIGRTSQTVSMPEGFEYFSPEQQQQFQESVAVGASPMVTIIFPLVTRFLGIWLGWFLLASILHLVLTLNGSRSSNRSILNVVSWASLPFVIRDLVQAVAIVSTGKLIRSPGLSGFVSADVTGFSLFLGSILAFVDIYFNMAIYPGDARCPESFRLETWQSMAGYNTGFYYFPFLKSTARIYRWTIGFVIQWRHVFLNDDYRSIYPNPKFKKNLCDGQAKGQRLSRCRSGNPERFINSSYGTIRFG